MTDWAAINARLEPATARERLQWAVDTYGADLLFTSSFGPGSAALLHLWSEVARALPVVFLDTGFHFAETLAFRDAVVAQLGLTLHVLRPTVPREDFLLRHGLTVYQSNPDFCCAHNKVAPLQAALPGRRAWVSGLRRDESPTRAGTPIALPTEGPVKVHPVATWSARDTWRYLRDHGLPEHPLVAQGYASVGCAPCTRPITAGEDERDGRWSGSGKTECGLHTFLKPTT